MKTGLAILLSFVLWMSFALKVEAQADETFEARVDWIIQEKSIEVMDRQQLYQKVTMIALTGSIKGNSFEYEHGLLPQSNLRPFKRGEVYVMGRSELDGVSNFYFVDRVRRKELYLLAGLFFMVVISVARWRAITSLAALALSFAILFVVVLPLLLKGFNPVLVSMISSLLIVPISFYLSHGWNRKTHVALIATWITLLLTALLAQLFVNLTSLSGYASEEATFLNAEKTNLNIVGLLLAGIIIGVVGILDDVTVAQAALVMELNESNPKLNRLELYRRAMNVGTDHIASMINTLILVYAGASMPLLLLFVNSPRSPWEIINYEMVAEEIVRTLVGSIGLVLAVPLTTILTVWQVKGRVKAKG